MKEVKKTKRKKQKWSNEHMWDTHETAFTNSERDEIEREKE